MTSPPAAYTPLETLLLFQALRADGVASLSVFSRISDQLQQIPLVRDDPAYDAARLSPDALRDLYLGLLKEEARRDLDGPDIDTAPVSGRKRKAPSPSLPTVQEASQHRHLIPQLVTRLYARYREHAVREIREQERRCDALARDISDIDAGKWDERLQNGQDGPAAANPVLSAAAQKEAATAKSQSGAMRPSPAPSAMQAPLHKYSQASIDAFISRGADPKQGSNARASPAPSTKVPLQASRPSQSPHPGVPNTPSGPGPWPPSPAPGYGQSPIGAKPTPFAHQHAHPAPGPVASPQTRGSFSPYPSVPPSVASTVATPQQFPAQQLPASGAESNDRPPPGSLAPTGHAPQQRGAVPVQQLGEGVSLPPTHDNALPSQPVSLGPQHAVRGSQNRPTRPQLPQMLQPGLAQHSPLSTRPHPPSAPATMQRPAGHSDPALLSHILTALATPPRVQRQPVWKSERRPPQLRVGTPLPTPGFEPLSPNQTQALRSRRSMRGAVEPSAESSPPPKTKRRRGRPKREPSPQSVASSAPDESTRMNRSQSVSTTTGPVDGADERPRYQGSVKAEPSTPAFTDERDTTREPSATPAGARLTRKRRGTLGSQTQTQPPAKRSRRQQTPSNAGGGAMSEAESSPPPRATTITAYRNFSKLSATIMNDINSHKHASYFANMVRDRDAPGYSSIIRRPQHLKSIRAAITAGTRAVAAALDTSPGGASGTAQTPAADGGLGAAVELEPADELVPPRAIVNGAQLEREVLRMLANAVLFNPGADGMVRDTREMFDDVEAQLRHWRGAERDGGGDQSVAVGGGGGDDIGDEGKSKRRKG